MIDHIIQNSQVGIMAIGLGFYTVQFPGFFALKYTISVDSKTEDYPV